MWWRVRVLRFLGLLSLIVWVGGFTFYSAEVIPVLHDVMPSRDAGRIIQRVTDRLNLVGAATVMIWLVLVSAERHVGTKRLRMRRGPTGCNPYYPRIPRRAACTDGSAALPGRMEGFNPWHQAYLIVGTVSWFVNLGLLGLSLRLWEKE
jgi:hypothetical protein